MWPFRQAFDRSNCSPSARVDSIFSSLAAHSTTWCSQTLTVRSPASWCVRAAARRARPAGVRTRRPLLLLATAAQWAARKRACLGELDFPLLKSCFGVRNLDADVRWAPVKCGELPGDRLSELSVDPIGIVRGSESLRPGAAKGGCDVF